ncbi:MAG: hypothetical protein WBP61_07780 [Nocardioides sp.]
MITFSRTLVPAVAAVLLLGLAVAPASAERATYRDPADLGGASLNDVRRVAVTHTTERVRVKVKVIDLRRRSEAGPAGLTIRIDTRAARPGPEFRLGTGLYDGTDYQLMRIRNGRPVGQPVSCAHSVDLDFARDVVRLRAADGCLGDPDRIRIGVKMTDLHDGSHAVTDWLGEPRSWTRWLSAG